MIRKGKKMVDVPTPDDRAEEATEGQEPPSLGDIGGMGTQDAVRDDEIVPDRREEGSSSS